HGDGIVRSGFLKEYYGEAIYEGFQKVKALFDPEYLLNPGKIVDPPPIDSHLRYGTSYHDLPFPAVYHYREQRDFFTAIHQCSGLGACRKITGGTMCPSFMVTRDEADSTRGRANVLRLAMSGQLKDGLANHDIPKVLDLCLSCKACKAECPSSVDMARLKSEVMQHQYDRYGATLLDKSVGKSPDMARWFSGRQAAIINFIQAMPVVKQMMMKLMGLDIRRNLPRYSLSKWTQIQKRLTQKQVNTLPDIILLVDTYTQCHQPETGVAAANLLMHLGKKVMLLDAGCCQRPRISHGFLRDAAARVQPGLKKLIPWLEKKIPVAVLEPSCASAWTDDIPDLITDDHQAVLLKQVRTFEQVLADVLKEKPDQKARLAPKSNQIRVHGHCHQKSIYGMEPVRSIFAHWPEVDFAEIDSGCCGMAGSFGYEAKHYAISKKMAERALIPAIEDAPDAMIIANGFSCQHQIQDFAHRKAVHIAEAFELLKS
ncbi:MAG TPA: 4Fe-4S dicluster domain-containing protein, partial [Saprospiraceae bacterium]|nr:4Fe-4S dicluster domain-containing protein [Saprospiraceae bacterium]